MVAILPLELRSYRLGITVTNKAYSVITDVEITVSPFNRW
jgi:hypothetical protein